MALTQIQTGMVADSAVTTAKIADANVTAAKLASGAAASNLGSFVSSVDGSSGAITLSSLAAFTKSLASAGYQKLPGGLIIQWGAGTASVGSTVTFPVAFTTTNYVVVPSIAGYSATGGMGADIFCVTNTSASQAKVGNNAGFNGITFRWIAIGY